MEVSRHWRLQQHRYGTASGGLRGSICENGHVQFPPGAACPECVAIGHHGLCLPEKTAEAIEATPLKAIVSLAGKAVVI